VSVDEFGNEASKQSLHHPRLRGWIGALCGFFFGLSAALTKILDLGWQASKLVYQLGYDTFWVCTFSAYIRSVAGRILWIYTPLGRRKFTYRPPNPTLTERKSGAALGAYVGIFVGLLGFCDNPPDSLNTYYGLYGIGALLVCLGAALIAFLLPYAFIP
jgi:hypothetical protein